MVLSWKRLVNNEMDQAIKRLKAVAEKSGGQGFRQILDSETLKD